MAFMSWKLSRCSAATVFTTLTVFGFMGLWLRNVNAVVPYPYLDEVFHVRQATAYWEHRWRQWDPKITTPPGLYLVSYVIGVMAYSLLRYPLHPHVPEFRSVNGLVLFNMLPISLRELLNTLWLRKLPSGASGPKDYSPEKAHEWELELTVLNICLFPPIFFFSGLYYTDLAALLITMQMYSYDLQRDHQGIETSKSGLEPTVRSAVPWPSIALFINGIAALLMRQTNVFWVVVFMGALRVVRRLTSISVDCKAQEAVDIAKGSWNLRQLFDPPVSGACFEDYLKTSLSLAIATLANIRVVLADLLPYFSILGAFALFVFWNGGVVLGHKEFHTASLHLPQMLYIWPYFLFFSWPVILSPWLVSVLRHSRLKPSTTRLIGILFRRDLMLCFSGIMIAVVHWNTVVHPFTLADNRHYVFYVFRILRQHPAIKYAVTPIYFVCAWLVLGTFGPSVAHVGQTPRRSSRQSEGNLGTQGVRVSFVLVWVLSTALSLITAPLVEPRYFIIPWVIWRLNISPTSFWLQNSQGTSPDGKGRAVDVRNRAGDKKGCTSLPPWLLVLAVEFLWFAAINIVTEYVFLYKGFEWPQEPGQVQRFMW